MARPSNKAERRNQIAEALMVLMAAHGYRGASVSAIAKRAGLNQGLVYYHFRSKLDVLEHVVSLVATRHRAHMDTAHAAVLSQHGTEDHLAQLDAFINVHLGLGAYADPQQLRCWIDISAEALREPQIQVLLAQIFADMRTRLHTIISAGCAAGDFRCDPMAAACALIATIQGYLVLAGTARELIPYGTAARSTQAMARGLLFSPSTL